jgi:hypothetical protein
MDITATSIAPPQPCRTEIPTNISLLDVRFTLESGRIADIGGCLICANRVPTHRSKKSTAIRSPRRRAQVAYREFVRPSALAVIAELAKKALDRAQTTHCLGVRSLSVTSPAPLS